MAALLNRTDYPGVAGKLFLVTGASGGIGSSCARLLAALGAFVALSGRNGEKLEKIRKELPGGPHLSFAADLALIHAEKWLNEIVSCARQPLAGIAHCAGINRPAPLRGYTQERLNADFETYIRQSASLFSAITRLTDLAQASSVVAMSSISAMQSKPGNALYGAARAAVESLVRSFAVEYAPAGIRFNCVRAGFVANTGMTEHIIKIRGNSYLEQIERAYPLGAGKAEDVANAVIFLLGSASSWITGATLVADGGHTIAGI